MTNETWEIRLRDALASLRTQHATIVTQLQRWCRQPSGSTDPCELAAMADMIASDFHSLASGPRRVPLAPYSRIDDYGVVNQVVAGELLQWDFAPEHENRVLLAIHYDTVYSALSSTSSVTLDDQGRLYGPGAADAKGGLLIMLKALETLRQFELDAGIGWTAVANPDEELGSPASASWFTQHAADYRFALLMEPPLPNGSLVSQRKGSGNFTVIVKGRSAHAGRSPELGRNAVTKLCRILIDIEKLGSQTSEATVNVARIHGGDALNRVPDLASGRFNVRVNDEASQQWIENRLQTIVENHSADEGYSIQLHGGFHAPPKQIDSRIRQLQKRIEKAAQVAGRTIHWESTGGVCDGNRLAALGLPNIDTLGPQGDGLHSPLEWVDTHSLVPAAQTILVLLAQYAAESQYAAKSGGHESEHRS